MDVTHDIGRCGCTCSPSSLGTVNMTLRKNVKRPSHGKLKLANLCWQAQVDMCERQKNSRQTSWQTVGNK